MVPTSNEVKEWRLGGYGRNGENGDEDENGNEPKKAFPADCDQRSDSISTHDFLFENELGSCAV